MATNNATNTSNPITVPQGGTGDASLTAYSVLCGGTTSTSAIQPIASVGTSGQLLTSNGASALPTFQSAKIPIANAAGVTLSTATWVDTFLYTFPYGATGTGTAAPVASNRVNVWLVYLPRTASYTGINLIISTLSAGNIRFGLYALDTNGMPGALVCDSGTISAGSTGVKTGAVNFNITAGYYYFAWNNSSTSHVCKAIIGANRVAGGFAIVDTGIIGPMDNFYYGLSFGAFPDPFPFASATVSVPTTVAMPFFYMT